MPSSREEPIIDALAPSCQSKRDGELLAPLRNFDPKNHHEFSEFHWDSVVAFPALTGIEHFFDEPWGQPDVFRTQDDRVADESRART
jgi:hypothetical protein